ncbi:MAG: hypothetical protein A2W90_08260 [Bacteroidetes bacterium GWF2_42_66]|nr:MAG: hypothetical protein A2W92_21085 [Bacteroidetes bacterium GWA2_42_15]OFX96466.1 MAG: hypothetical protein A2W89_05920 [Bacteroidetes bacterium GWE2_42_39]OFY40886.1 MAG: hypothetical protein A2W90_08260 [Bacteroidetes bacterium GWF2_42_66]HBL76317.1 hypothetical protein [Prolixibacteraceae bacterium]HCR92129.1 hypothetical protein [Prolixibacteraceae bacterium]
MFGLLLKSGFAVFDGFPDSVLFGQYMQFSTCFHVQSPENHICLSSVNYPEKLIFFSFALLK